MLADERVEGITLLVVQSALDVHLSTLFVSQGVVRLPGFPGNDTGLEVTPVLPLPLGDCFIEGQPQPPVLHGRCPDQGVDVQQYPHRFCFARHGRQVAPVPLTDQLSIVPCGQMPVEHVTATVYLFPRMVASDL